MKKRLVLNLIFITCFVLLFSIVGRAEEAINPDADEAIVITATRTPETETEAPGKSDVVTEEQIKDSGATTVSESLSDAGISIASNGGMSGVSNIILDDSASTQTLILINGVPANTGGVGTYDLSYFPTIGVKKIEVAHGPLSALYGSGAAGGVINIITELTGEPRNETVVRYGDYNTQGAALKFQQPNWGLAFGGDYTNGEREWSQTHAYYLLGQYNFYETAQDYLKLYWQFFNKYGQNPGKTTWPVRDDQSTFDAAINLNGSAGLFGGQWEYKIFKQYLDFHYHTASTDTNDRHQTNNYGIDAAGQYIFDQNEIVCGVLYRDEALDSTTDNGNHERSNLGLYVQDSWQLNGQFKLVSGLRQDFYTGFNSPLTPRISLIGQINDELTLKAAYGQTFRAPTLDDMYFNDPWMIGNPALTPEKGERYDLIGEWKRGSQSLAIDVFQSRLRDGIDWRPQNPADPYSIWQVKNIQNVSIQGFSVNWANTWTNGITARIGYNLLDKKATDSVLGDDQEYNYFGKQQLNLGLDYYLNSWQAGMNWCFVSGRNYYSSGALKTMPDYNVLNLHIGYRFNPTFSASLAIDNLGGQYYQINQDYPMPGRLITLSGSYTF